MIKADFTLSLEDNEEEVTRKEVRRQVKEVSDGVIRQKLSKILPFSQDMLKKNIGVLNDINASSLCKGCDHKPLGRYLVELNEELESVGKEMRKLRKVVGEKKKKEAELKKIESALQKPLKADVRSFYEKAQENLRSELKEIKKAEKRLKELEKQYVLKKRQYDYLRTTAVGVVLVNEALKKVVDEEEREKFIKLYFVVPRKPRATSLLGFYPYTQMSAAFELGLSVRAGERLLNKDNLNKFVSDVLKHTQQFFEQHWTKRGDGKKESAEQFAERTFKGQGFGEHSLRDEFSVMVLASVMSLYANKDFEAVKGEVEKGVKQYFNTLNSLVSELGEDIRKKLDVADVKMDLVFALLYDASNVKGKVETSTLATLTAYKHAFLIMNKSKKGLKKENKRMASAMFSALMSNGVWFTLLSNGEVQKEVDGLIRQLLKSPAQTNFNWDKWLSEVGHAYAKALGVEDKDKSLDDAMVKQALFLPKADARVFLKDKAFRGKLNEMISALYGMSLKELVNYLSHGNVNNVKERLQLGLLNAKLVQLGYKDKERVELAKDLFPILVHAAAVSPDLKAQQIVDAIAGYLPNREIVKTTLEDEMKTHNVLNFRVDDNPELVAAIAVNVASEKVFKYIYELELSHTTVFELKDAERVKRFFNVEELSVASLLKNERVKKLLKEMKGQDYVEKLKTIVRVSALALSVRDRWLSEVEKVKKLDGFAGFEVDGQRKSFEDVKALVSDERLWEVVSSLVNKENVDANAVVKALGLNNVHYVVSKTEKKSKVFNAQIQGEEKAWHIMFDDDNKYALTTSYLMAVSPSLLQQRFEQDLARHKDNVKEAIKSYHGFRERVYKLSLSVFNNTDYWNSVYEDVKNKKYENTYLGRLYNVAQNIAKKRGLNEQEVFRALVSLHAPVLGLSNARLERVKDVLKSVVGISEEELNKMSRDDVLKVLLSGRWKGKAVTVSLNTLLNNEQFKQALSSFGDGDYVLVVSNKLSIFENMTEENFNQQLLTVRFSVENGEVKVHLPEGNVSLPLYTSFMVFKQEDFEGGGQKRSLGHTEMPYVLSYLSDHPRSLFNVHYSKDKTTHVFSDAVKTAGLSLFFGQGNNNLSWQVGITTEERHEVPKNFGAQNVERVKVTVTTRKGDVTFSAYTSPLIIAHQFPLPLNLPPMLVEHTARVYDVHEYLNASMTNAALIAVPTAYPYQFATTLTGQQINDAMQVMSTVVHAFVDTSSPILNNAAFKQAIKQGANKIFVYTENNSVKVSTTQPNTDKYFVLEKQSSGNYKLKVVEGDQEADMGEYKYELKEEQGGEGKERVIGKTLTHTIAADVFSKTVWMGYIKGFPVRIRVGGGVSAHTQLFYEQGRKTPSRLKSIHPGAFFTVGGEAALRDDVEVGTYLTTMYSPVTGLTNIVTLRAGKTLNVSESGSVTVGGSLAVMGKGVSPGVDVVSYFPFKDNFIVLGAGVSKLGIGLTLGFANNEGKGVQLLFIPGLSYLPVNVYINGTSLFELPMEAMLWLLDAMNVYDRPESIG